MKSAARRTTRGATETVTCATAKLSLDTPAADTARAFKDESIQIDWSRFNFNITDHNFLVIAAIFLKSTISPHRSTG